jgi:hypothetical protein
VIRDTFHLKQPTTSTLLATKGGVGVPRRLSVHSSGRETWSFQERKGLV